MRSDWWLVIVKNTVRLRHFYTRIATETDKKESRVTQNMVASQNFSFMDSWPEKCVRDVTPAEIIQSIRAISSTNEKGLSGLFMTKLSNKRNRYPTPNSTGMLIKQPI